MVEQCKCHVNPANNKFKEMKKIIISIILLFCVNNSQAQNYQSLYPNHTTKIFFLDVNISDNLKNNQSIIKTIEKREKALFNVFEMKKEYFELEKVNEIEKAEIIFFRNYTKNDSLEFQYSYENYIYFKDLPSKKTSNIGDKGKDSSVITKFLDWSDEINENMYKFAEFDVPIRTIYFPLKNILEPKNHLFTNTAQKYFLNKFIQSKNPKNQPIADTLTHFVNNMLCSFQEQVEILPKETSIELDIKYFPNYRYKTRKKEMDKKNDIEIIGEIFEKEKDIYVLQFTFIGKEIELTDILGEKINTSIEFNIKDFKSKKFSFLQYNLLKMFRVFFINNY